MIGADRAGELEELRTEVLAFLDANAARRPAREALRWGSGPEAVVFFEDADPEVEREQIVRAKRWRAQRADAGLAYLTGPAEHGGRELGPECEDLYVTLESGYDVPDCSCFALGLATVTPTIVAHATGAAKERYVRPLWRGEIIACQLFSEPGAGSDLAGVEMRAERDGDGWVLNGQKVWTSGAHYSDIGEVIARSDPTVPKHQGLSGFLVDMRAPGVEVRPLRQITGGSSFNEVFFTDVRVPGDHLLGEPGDGWKVALTTLMNERAGFGPVGERTSALEHLVEMVRHHGRADDPVIRQALMRLHSGHRILGFLHQTAADKVESGRTPGPELTLSKMALIRNILATVELLGNVLGPSLVADTGEWGTFAWTQYVVGHPGMRVAGGTDEVLRNIVGERVLGLPKEPPAR